MNDGPLSYLRAVCARQGLEALGGELARVITNLERDLASFESELRALRGDPSVVGRSADHLLALEGKRIRPLLVSLSARVGTGFGPEAMHLALAVELIHSATLLHDDVVDLGTTRRGVRTARMVYGNAASIFAGDWLLVEALRRVRRSNVAGTLDRLLSVVEEMIFAEAVQLERRGRLEIDRLDEARRAYFRIVEGKTASLFRWAAYAGGRAGEVTEEVLAALDGYALDLGVAFQAIDDAIDLGAHGGAIQKTLAADLREGKITYPILVGLERDERGELRPLLEEVLDAESVSEALRERVVGCLRATSAIEATVALAKDRARSARAHLEPLAAGPAKALLEIIAEAMVHRNF